MFRPVLDVLGHSIFLTALVAMLPLVTLFILLGVLRISAWKTGLVSLVVSILVAIFAYRMPAGMALSAGLEGAAFGFFPILWIVINAIWVYNMTVETGHFDVLRRSFARISDDLRIQAVIIAFCFGALLEALAGFGTPVAITSVMLIALGFRPMKAAVISLVANTAPVAFGALSVPITTLAKVSGENERLLASIVGRQTPLLGLFVPIALVWLVDRKGVKATLPATLSCGLAFAAAQFVTSNWLAIPLTDIVASLAGAAAVIVVLRFWKPKTTYSLADHESDEARPKAAQDQHHQHHHDLGIHDRTPGGGDHAKDAGAASASEYAERDARANDTSADVLKAYAPYLIIIAVFSLSQIPAIKGLLEAPTATFNWPGLEGLQTSAGKPSTIPQFKLNWLSAAGTLMIISGLITIPVIGIKPGKALKAYAATYKQLLAAIVTVMAVLGLAYVMNASGQTATLGAWLAGAGAAFAILSPILGWLGVAVTGSDTSANSLFGALQVSAAKAAGLDPALMAAANSSGGVLGKMISPQNLAIAAAAVGLSGREGDILRKVIGWSLVFLAFMCVLVFLQSNVLAWMLP